MGKHGIRWKRITLLDLNNPNDLVIPDQNASVKNEFSKVLRVQGLRTALNIILEKTRPLGIGINEDKEAMLCNEKLQITG